ncbi:hypothetical protein, conserved [Eimeria necatrix]|uniref:Uncharacterized protein n=1 Tax=Eimeria necatrix TaxID=51315 RepID=U6MRV6_9EIME|nr:hypothetical protein, conserved [Eimeria necatrix]CDJ64390.1 hypothetical protein, conserved [Eimeria necatrix]
MAFTRSEKSGARSRAGGLSERLDSLIAETATSGLPQKLKEKLTAGEKTTVKDFEGINFAHVEQPKPTTWQKYLKLELLDSMHEWLRQPETTERIKNECNGGKGSNIVALFRDSMDLLKSSEAENLTLIGKVVSPRETSVGKPWGFKSVLQKLLRLPPYKTQHHSFVAVDVKIPETLEIVRVLVNVYTQNKGNFANQEVFFRAVTDLFEHYEQKNRLSSGGPLGVPESLLVPPLHRNYAALPKEDRLQALKDSAMANFFRHIWTLIFSVSAHNILNAGNLDSLEKTFSDEAWQLSINDPFQASSFGMVMMGGDMGLKLFNELLPTDQKRMLKKAKYGSPTVFTSQMQLTGSLLSASGHSGLGMFLHAQSVYFGVMIKKWIQKRKEDRIREIISWLTLGMFFAASFVQVTDGVMEITNTGNETGQASMTGSCPPMGLCVDSSGNTFIANPTGSPALTALQVVMKTGLMASMAMIAGPLVAVYNIAVSHIQILSRLEMALGNTFRQLVTRLSKSKTIKNIKKLFAKEEKLEKGKKAGAAKVSKSLGDEVEQSITAFFQESFHERQERCQR